MDVNFLKYLTLSPETEDLGLYVTNAGHNLIKPNDDYPYSEHPLGYLFEWEKGRVLDEFQVNYIIEGQGIFESASCKKRKVKTGSIILVFPNEWHRYKPIKKIGWDEYWIGYKGSIAQDLLRLNMIEKNNPVIEIGFDERTFSLYQELIELIKEESFGYQLLAAGILLQIIGKVREIDNRKYFQKNENLKQIRKAKIKLTENLDQTVSPENVAQSINMSYSSFRKVFKRYVGISPGQYQLQHRIIKSKELLCRPDLTIKEIAYHLGFESNSHFSKVFKNKTGLSPRQFREMTQGKQVLTEAESNYP